MRFNEAMHRWLAQIAERGQAVADRASDGWREVESRSVVAQLLADLYRRYKRTNASLIVGSLAYRIFLFIVPCVLVVVALAGYANASGGDAGAGTGQDLRLSEALRSAISQAGQDSGNGWHFALLIGLAGALMGAYSLYTTLFLGYAQVWELPSQENRKRLASIARFVGGLVVFIGFLYAMAWVRRHGPILGGAGITISIAVSLGLFVLMSLALPHRGHDWVNMVPGAVAGGAATLGLQTAAATWLPNQIADRSQTYGVLGVAIALLAYLALIGSVLVLIPLVNATWLDHVEARGGSERLAAFGERAQAMVRRSSATAPSDGGDGDDGPAAP